MPVVGVGIDLVSVSGFEAQLKQPGTTMLSSFSPGERRDAGGDARSLAARWAAKEAVFKAFSSSFYGRRPAEKEVGAREVEVVADAWGRPAVRVHGRIAEDLGQDVRIHLSLTHDGDIAGAVAVIETV
ncbi:holo-ACP synthase [Tsukamurella sp. 8F]|uniref:holo-ACP synthase AcpS n=1 Tax=unclassified Tsukamurella TaxID=2633480 RepID=UPI0023B8FC16|nr:MULTISPECIES: holo-ACP synthase [unclassified Tsukamurella]MDF0531022.1 holo-ACP synthase [Tsukamurella sp. 8J]MDF0589265.1 holo-ACP synthase [Tsukamurella sp. 8F]